ncbi:MAG: glycoside hydrolase family 57 protein [Infirmifilum sp.]
MVRLTSTLDKVVLLEQENIEVDFTISNEDPREIEGKPYIILRVQGKEELYLLFDDVKLAPGGSREFKAKIKVPPVTGEGTLGIYFEERGKITASNEYPVYVAKKGDPIYVAFVWHHHQAPNFYPDGHFKDLWAYKHVFEGDFYGHPQGPYAIHMGFHRQYPDFRDVDHFSPSLLEQWELVLKEEPNAPDYATSRRSELESLVSTLKSLATQGIIEPLGSVYAHTILGFILRKALQKGLFEEAKTLIKWEISQGMKIVERVIGRRPKGFWTPEMFWSMDLVNIYRETGIEYTVLCEQHFSKAGGEKDSIYTPYIVQDPVTSSSIVVFFRDLALSNWISFNVDFKDPQEADLSARRFVVELAKRRESAPNGIVVIALDGENWMIMPSYRRYAPYFLEKIIKYLDDSNILKTITLEQYLEKHKPERVLTYVPYGSWINLTDRQWTGDGKDQLWEKAFQALSYVFSLYKSLGEDAWKISQDENTELYKALKALSIAMDSDFYWYGEIEKEANFIRVWADTAVEIVDNFFKRSLKATILDRGKNHIILQLENHSSLPLQVTLNVEARNYKNETKITLKPKTIKKVPVYTPSGDDTKFTLRVGSVEQVIQAKG